MTSTERILQYQLAGVILTMWICTLILIPMIINYWTSRSAEMVRASETRYRELFDNTSSGVAIYEARDGGKDFILKDFNKAGERIDGARKEDIIGKSIHEVRPGIKEFGLLDVFERVWKTGIPEHHPASFYHDQKLAVWFENFVYKLPTGEMVCVYDDITDRMRAQEALRESEGKYRRIVETASEGICMTDVDNLITYVNQRMADMLGYRPEEIIGKPLVHFLFPKDLADHQEKWSHRLQGLSETYERRFRRSDGGECWTIVSVTVIRNEDGRFMGAFGMLTDITERKRAENALQLSERSLRRAEVVSGFGNWEFILGWDKVKASEGARIIYGLEGTEWSIPEVQKIALPEYRGMLDKALNRLVEEGKPYNVEFKICRPSDGKIIDIHSIAEYSPEKRVVFGVIQDITDRKRAEEALLESNARTSHLNDVLRAIRDVGRLINREKDPIELLNAVCHSLVQTRSYVMVWIGKPEADSKRVLPVAHSGGDADLLQHAPITWDDSPTGHGPAGTAIRERRVVVFDDLATDPRFALWRDPVMSYGGASIASVPIMHDESLFGVLTVKADRPHAFDVEEVELLSNLAAELARALQSLENEAARKRAEEALQDSETRYRLLADNATDVIWTTGMDMQLTYVSPSVTRLLHYTVEEAMARTMRQAYAPASREKAMRVFAEEMAIESAGNADPTRSLMLELELVRKGGNTVLVEANFCFLRDPTGKAIGVLAIARDITERKNAAKALHESELRLRTILQTANEGFWLIDNDTVTTDLNPRMCAILGRNREEVFGRKIFDFVDSENKAIFKQQIGLRAQGEVGAYEIALSRPDGSNVLCQFNSTPLFDGSGNVVGSFAMVADISERKRAEIALRMSEERFSRFFRSTPVGTSISHLIDGRFVDVNDAFLGLFGYTREEVIGQNPLKLGMWANPEDRVKVIEILQEEGRIRDFETQLVRKSGEIVDVLGSAEVIEMADESYMLSLAYDITERRRAEEERRRLEGRLQRAEKMEALGTLAGGVAHDLNNVLGVIVGYSELLLYNLGEPSTVKSRAEAILKGGLRAAAIVQDLLTLARRGVSNRKVLNFNNIVLKCRNSPEFAGISSYHPNIRLNTDLDANLLNISGSAVHLSKSLINLVSNAAEAMPEGGVITIKTVNQYLDKPVSGYDEVREGDYVVLSVSDTGQGIPAGDLKHIFEPFYTKKVMGRSGTGLGLAVIWGTVKDHLGYINVDSQEGKGTIFTLYFPVTREEISQEQVSISAAEYMGKGESILIVDDVKEQRELAGTMLKMLNYNVVSVSSGEEAVEYLKQNEVDLVVLDMIMDPGMDGLDTYAKILEIHTHQRAIIVSGFSETERVSRAQALGAGTYVKKPYVLEELGLGVRKELDRPA
ncbi:MAG: PAS domain S-box protein [Syntrophobacteraceae bacterium]